MSPKLGTGSAQARGGWGRAQKTLRRQSIGIVALFVALGGTGYAAATLPKDSVRAKQIKANAVGGPEIKDAAVTGGDVQDRSLSVADFAGGLPAGEPGPQGPVGETGQRGPAGETGTAGTARAYAYVTASACVGAPPSPCPLARSKGVASVTRTSTGAYCVTAPGLDPTATPALVSGDYQGTANPESQGEALWHGGVHCGPSGYQVITKRTNVATVRDAAGTGTTTVADDSDAQANNISFVIAIP
jgi:hypothetical protein